jgi:hemerythrin-like metal-binding protein
MAKIVWREQMAIGVSEIDDDHRALIGILNNLAGAIQAPHFHAAPVLDIVTAFERWALEHFQREERLMLSVRYPRFDEHHKLHVGGLASIRELGRTFETFPHRENANELYRFAAGWLVRHIIAEDRQIAAFLAQSDAGVPVVGS